MAFDFTSIAVTVATGVLTGAFGALIANRLSLAKSDHEDRRAKIEEAQSCMNEIEALAAEYTSRCVNFIAHKEVSGSDLSKEFSKEYYKFFSDTRFAVRTKATRLMFLAESYLGYSRFYAREVYDSLELWNEMGIAFEDSMLHGEKDAKRDHKINIENSEISLIGDLIPVHQLIRVNYRKPSPTVIARRWVRHPDNTDGVGPLMLEDKPSVRLIVQRVLSRLRQSLGF